MKIYLDQQVIKLLKHQLPKGCACTKTGVKAIQAFQAYSCPGKKQQQMSTFLCWSLIAAMLGPCLSAST